MDNGDNANNSGINTTDKDNDTLFTGDWDYYNNPTANANAATTPATASNTALHLVTNIGSQIWEFHVSTGSGGNWDHANGQATDHGLWGSNTSRLASLAEAFALYAANFGGDGATRTPNTVGAVQPMSNVGTTNGFVDAEVNFPGGWGASLWTAAPTPSGHARMTLYWGSVLDNPDVNVLTVAHVSAVL